MVRARLNPVLTQDQPSLAIQEAPRKLLFVEAIINSTPTKALVDSKATHNFLLEKEAPTLDQLDFLMLRIDDFDVILGADFATKAKARIFLHCNGILICGGKHSCFVQGPLRREQDHKLSQPCS
ncbi:unnamed protein product [Spirodela intermedia]|uniref:Uncharacterized protein n=1 Tax=Spirodela intermedia TaxID=51605 RepID=A0A7I8IT17_SPIIN|nr:unnamed protein product [Spirodela intermedia]CAA6661112.1 unnamed protein product [Spirodela intermedia]